jgi:hypothetical protein
MSLLRLRSIVSHPRIQRRPRPKPRTGSIMAASQARQHLHNVGRTQWEWYEDDKLDPTSTCFALFMNTIVDAVGNLLKVA